MPPASQPHPPLLARFVRHPGAWRAYALLLLLLVGVGLAAQATRGALPASVDLPPIEAPLTFEGATIASLAELRFQVQRHAVGERLELPHAGSVVLVPESGLLGRILSALGSLAYLAVVAFVLAPRAARPEARRLALAMGAAAVGISIGGIYPADAPWGGVLLPAYLGALCVMPAAFVAFTLEFPLPVQFAAGVGRALGRLRAAALVLVPVLVTALNLLAWVAYTRRPTPAGWRQAENAYHLVEALLVVGFGVGIALLVRAGRRAPHARERAQARWLLWGIAVAMTPFVLLRCLPRLVGLPEPPVPPEVDRLVELAAPAAFAIAVARHLLLDIDMVIRRSLIASVLAVLLTATVLAVALLLGHGGVLPLPTPAVWLLAGLGAGALYLPARRLVGRWVDRTFFRLRHEHDKALEAVLPALSAATGPEEVAEALERTLQAELEPHRLDVRLAEGAELARAERAGWNDGQARAAPLATTSPGLPGPDAEAWPAGAAVVQPIARAGRLVGWIALGGRESGHAYVEDDLAFLAALGARAAEALERLRLVGRLAAEAGARSALAALDRQRREFLMRVAHDLRTPLTAVRWSAANLKDGVAGDLTQAQGQELEGIVAASSQLTRLVENLVALSRMEAGDPRAAPEPVALEPLVREAITGLAALARAKEVEVTARLGEVPEVRGRRDGLAQVVMNLLDNALKYAPPRSRVDVDLGRAADGGAVLFTVRDRGPGLKGTPAATLFGLFGQGAPSPHASAQGLGVGLHVVKSQVEAFGGSVVAADHPEGGAQFTCRMAPWQPLGGPA